MEINYYDEEDEDILSRPFENGRWEWNHFVNQLIFVSDLIPIESDIKPKCFRKLEFKEEVDLMEEQRFKKHFQRQTTNDDVVTLQDVKDVVFFTAPRTILTCDVINILHLRAMQRFLRGLIFYCQYYLQIATEMNSRVSQLQYKIKTPRSHQIEDQYKENLEDLRLLLAKEYSGLILGADEYSKYHHMGVYKLTSLMKKDTLFFETILHISIHIVWIALGRQSFQQIAFPTSNLYERGFRPTVTVLTKDRNRVHITRLGYLQLFCRLNARLLYFERILSSPENLFKYLDLSLGIIGLPCGRFDNMLREVKKPSSANTSTTSLIKNILRMSSSKTRSSIMKNSKDGLTNLKLYPDIILPDNVSDTSDRLPDIFPGKKLQSLSPNNEQRLKWLHQAALMRKRHATKYSI